MPFVKKKPKKNNQWLYIAFNDLRDSFVNVSKSVKSKNYFKKYWNWQGYNNNLSFFIQKSNEHVWFSKNGSISKEKRGMEY